MNEEEHGPERHEVGIIIPLSLELVDETTRWMREAGEMLAERFGRSVVELGWITFRDQDGEWHHSRALKVYSLVWGPLRDFDLTAVYGLAMRISASLQVAGVVVIVDGDTLIA